MKLKSIRRNFIFNILLTFANMCFPLITAPYLSRVLGASGIGRVNFATVIINWFIIGSSFGIPRFAIREIAKNRNNKEKMSNIFWNLVFIQFVFVIFFLTFYLLLIFLIPFFREELKLYLIIGLMLIFNIISIDWFYQGIEEYSYITIRNVIVRLISVSLIFLMINNTEDYIYYALINALVIVINNTINFIHALSIVHKRKIEIKFLYFLKKLRIFFKISLVVALYTQLDQVFLGSISQRDLAFHIRSKSVLSIGLSLTTALVTVISPRAAFLAHNNWPEYKKMTQKTLNYIYLIGVPIAIGMFMLAKEAMYVLGGDEFASASLSLRIIAPLSLISILGSWISGQVLIPNKMEEQSFKIQCVSVFISITLNLILIPHFSYIGAAISWLIVETFLFLVKAIFVNLYCKEIKINYINLSLLKYLTSAICMFFTILIIKQLIYNPKLIILTSVPLGAIAYFFSLIILRERIVLSIISNYSRMIFVKRR